MSTFWVLVGRPYPNQTEVPPGSQIPDLCITWKQRVMYSLLDNIVQYMGLGSTVDPCTMGMTSKYVSTVLGELSGLFWLPYLNLHILFFVSFVTRISNLCTAKDLLKCCSLILHLLTVTELFDIQMTSEMPRCEWVVKMASVYKWFAVKLLSLLSVSTSSFDNTL